MTRGFGRETAKTYRGAQQEDDVHQGDARLDDLRDCLGGSEPREESERVGEVVFWQSAKQGEEVRSEWGEGG